MSDGVRRMPARAGIAALNMLMPGLGLLRLGRLRLGGIFLMVAPGVLLAILLHYVIAPRLTFVGYAASILLVILFYVAAVVASIAVSWRGSRSRAPNMAWWSRWYGLIGVYLVLTLAASFLAEAAHRFYKPFYLPSESMVPTLLVNDRLIASMRGPGELRRGDIILFDVGSRVYISRVAALPGDRIAMDDGVVILNGRPVEQIPAGTQSVAPTIFGTVAQRMREQFPGEARAHEIHDLGYSSYDDMAEQQVAPGHVFVLGDNRDMSADSRVPRTDRGVEQLPITAIRGRALFRTWGPSGKTGAELTP